FVAGTDDAADSTFSSDTGGFRSLAVFKRHDKRRHCSCKGKMGRDHVLFRLEEHLPMGKLHKLDVRLKQPALDNRHCREETIARPTASNVVAGHALPLICWCLCGCDMRARNCLSQMQHSQVRHCRWD